MKICVTLDDVIRAKSRQFFKIFKKVGIDPNFEVPEEENFTTNSYCDLCHFETKEKYQKFLYEDYPFEIFGEAEVMDKMLDKNFNLWCLKLSDNDEIEENIELMFGNPMEFNASIGYTCFFLSKIATRIREFCFPSDSLTLWDKCDVMITADPHLIENKPEGKKCIKIKMPYNKDVEADIEYESLYDFINDNEWYKKIKNG